MNPAVSTPVLDVTHLTRTFRIRGGRGYVRALDGVHLQVPAGASVGLVGESGSGKSTLARIVAGLIKPTSGSIRLIGADAGELSARRRRTLGRDVQMIFQDPRASLNPRLPVRRIIAEPLVTHGLSSSAGRIAELLDMVGLPRRFADHYPHQLSGGQCQRVGIARAIAVRPRLIVADEPVSALDISVQAQILNLLKGFQEELGTAFLFISHDLGVVRFFSERVAVMYLGRIVEEGETETVFAAPRHPYTQALESAAPAVRFAERRERIVLAGEPPKPEEPPGGCPFHTRCHRRIGPVCDDVEPVAIPVGDGYAVCHLLDDTRNAHASRSDERGLAAG